MNSAAHGIRIKSESIQLEYENPIRSDDTNFFRK